MSFTADNGATVNGSTITTGSDSRATGGGQANGAGNRLISTSSSYLVTTAAGTTTFTGVYRVLNAGTSTFTAHSIIVQVY